MTYTLPSRSTSVATCPVRQSPAPNKRVPTRPPSPARPEPLCMEQLVNYFKSGCKPEADWRYAVPVAAAVYVHMSRQRRRPPVRFPSRLQSMHQRRCFCEICTSCSIVPSFCLGWCRRPHLRSAHVCNVNSSYKRVKSVTLTDHGAGPGTRRPCPRSAQR